MQLLAFGDTHIKGAGQVRSYEELSLPAGTDAIVHTGDLVHDTSSDNAAAGREFIKEISNLGVPVFTVPGNHDPVKEQRKLVAEFSDVEVLHEDMAEIGDITIVGYGCEEFDQGPEVDIRDFESLDPRGTTNRRYAADRSASQLETALYEYTTGEISFDELEDTLEIGRDERTMFREQVVEFSDRYETLSPLFTTGDGRSVFVSHIPPYGTDLDRHHSIGERESDLAELHVGSIAQKVALRIHRPNIALSGHSHQESYETLTDEQPPVHLLNNGYQGVAAVKLDPETGAFGFDRYSD